jgi:hypothetical protein
MLMLHTHYMLQATVMIALFGTSKNKNLVFMEDSKHQLDT